MSRVRAPAASFDIALLAAGSAAFSTSTLFSAMKPVLIARLVEQAGYSASLAGLAAAMPFLGGMVASLMLPWLLRRLDASTAVVCFGICLALAEVANAAWFASVPLLLAGQFVAGLCGGALLGLLSQRIATSARSDQSFGIVDMVGVLLMSAMIAAIGIAVGWAGLRGAFLVAAALCAIFAGVIIATRDSLAMPALSIGSAEPPTLTISLRAIAVIAMGVLFITFSGLGFAYMVTAALKLGMTYEDAGSKIGLILFFSASGCVVGGWCVTRFGARTSLLGAFMLCALGWHVALHTHSQTVFLLALGPAIFALQFCFPILVALPGSMDPHGRLAAIAAPMIVSGFAWAAITAGMLVARWGSASLSIATELGMGICATLLIVATGGLGESTGISHPIRS